MTYGCAAHRNQMQVLNGAAVSHLAELVRGNFGGGEEGPLIRSFGPPSPQGEKGRRRHAPSFQANPPHAHYSAAALRAARALWPGVMKWGRTSAGSK